MKYFKSFLEFVKTPLEVINSTIEQLSKKANVKLVKDIDYPTFTNSTNLDLICLKCNKPWNPPYKKIINYKYDKCPNCRNLKPPTQQEATQAVELKCKEKGYSFEPFIYSNRDSKINLFCPKHNTKWTSNYKNFISDDKGCIHCGNEESTKKRTRTTEEFIKLSKDKFGDKYKYDLVDYKLNKTSVSLICPNHGVFDIRPDAHLNQKQGCPDCGRHFKVSEDKLKKLLEDNSIKYTYQYKNIIFGKQTLDFYLPEYKIGIEHQGVQHFIPNILFGGEQGYEKMKERDIKKKQICEENNIDLLYFTYYPKYASNYDLGKVFTNESDLINYIKNK
jgi:hypothetical protein